MSKNKDLAFITCFLVRELEHRGTIFQIFDECYEIAKRFQKKYSHDPDWINQELEFDDAIIKFLKDERA